jgi:hypothetical protein
LWRHVVLRAELRQEGLLGVAYVQALHWLLFVFIVYRGVGVGCRPPPAGLKHWLLAVAQLCGLAYVCICCPLF